MNAYGGEGVSIKAQHSEGRQDLSKKLMQHHSHETGASPERFEIICSWCGALIRAGAEEDEEQMCLICHARMLNDYFQKLRKLDGGGRTRSRRRL
jgi:hypothetical protein